MGGERQEEVLIQLGEPGLPVRRLPSAIRRRPFGSRRANGRGGSFCGLGICQSEENKAEMHLLQMIVTRIIRFIARL
jgi:hypothetical protein